MIHQCREALRTNRPHQRAAAELRAWALKEQSDTHGTDQPEHHEKADLHHSRGKALGQTYDASVWAANLGSYQGQGAETQPQMLGKKEHVGRHF